MPRTLPNALLFDLKAAARAADLDDQILRTWVMFGVIEPAVRGRTGKNAGHRFNDKQLLGIAVATALVYSPRKCGRGYAKEVIDNFSGLDDAARDWWLTDAVDEAAAESVAASKAGPAATRLFGDFGNPSLPSDRLTHADIFRRLRLVADALRARGVALGPAAGVDPAPGRLTPGGTKGRSGGKG
jgi:hypothetical protein